MTRKANEIVLLNWRFVLKIYFNICLCIETGRMESTGVHWAFQTIHFTLFNHCELLLRSSRIPLLEFLHLISIFPIPNLEIILIFHTCLFDVKNFHDCFRKTFVRKIIYVNWVGNYDVKKKINKGHLRSTNKKRNIHNVSTCRDLLFDEYICFNGTYPITYNL